MRFPPMFPPVSPAIAVPYPSTCTLLPSGMTLGSTATTFFLGLLFKSIPVVVIPEHPEQSAEYAVAVICSTLLLLLLLLLDLLLLSLLPLSELFLVLLLLSEDSVVKFCSGFFSFVPSATMRFSLSCLTSL